MEGINVLSLFDGMGCSWIALKEAGIFVNKAYASEIDKFAIKQTQLNFPDTVQLGDVTKWKEWDIDWKSIDLVLAGSPCQGFSFAGKQLAFEDPRSKLFFVFIDILNHIRSLNPNVLFLLENVKMKKDYLNTISEYCGVSPVNINSNLVSAQNRNRWYWTNICERIPQPIDKGIFLKDILEDEVDDKYYITSKCLDYITQEFRLRKKYTQIDSEGKSLPLMAHGRESQVGDYVTVAMRGRKACLTLKRTEYGKAIRKDYEAEKVKEQRKNIQRLEPRYDGKTNCLTSVQKDNLVLENTLNERQKANYKSGNQKANSFLATSWKGSQANGMTLVGTEIIRRLTPTECARLQTIPDWYKWECSDTQQYRMLGNGWTVDVIVHILSFIK